MQISTHTRLWSKSVVSEKAFTRKRSLPFITLVLMILNLPKRSLSIEINSFFSHIQQKQCSKSAFCQQRAKLKPFFFKLWNKVLVKSFYNHYNERLKRWKGFTVLAFDDSVISLPDSEALRDVYGQVSNGKGRYGVAAQGCVMYDVLNKVIIESKLLPYMTCERSVVMEQLAYAPNNSLLLFDRGYPCFWLFYLLSQKQQYKFVVRVKSSFNQIVKDFESSSQKDFIAEFRPSQKSIEQLQPMGIKVTKDTSIDLRLVKIPLKSGETEILITNLYSQQSYSREDLKQVYFMRWGVETCFGILKNQVQIENFSGIRQLCIEQDFFANIFVYNLQSILEKQCQQALEKVSSHRKYNYQINKNSSWAFLKNRMVDLFLKKDSREILLELQNLFEQSIEPIRPNRSYPRIHTEKNKYYGKYNTITNYKRAV